MSSAAPIREVNHRNLFLVHCVDMQTHFWAFRTPKLKIKLALSIQPEPINSIIPTPPSQVFSIRSRPKTGGCLFSKYPDMLPRPTTIITIRSKLIRGGLALKE